MKKRLLGVVLSVAMVSALLAGCGSSDSGSEEPAATESSTAGEAGGKTAADYKIAVVPKMTNLAWFERMEVGVEDYNEANGTEVEYCGSPEGDGQAAFVEGLISQGYDAICVVPFDVEALDPVLAKAKDAGITVICHEASTVENMDYDVEAFDTLEYGAHLMEKINELTGGEGRVIQTVGALTSQSHVEEAQGGKEWAEANAEGLKVDDQPIVSDDNEETAYNKVKEALSADPSIVAIQCAAMSETPGAAHAVEELGLEGKVHICGTSLMSVCGEYVENGTVELMSFWDPALAGQAMIELAVAVLNGEVTGQDEISLNVPGYEKLTLSNGNVYTGSAWIDVTAENCDDEAYDF